MCHYFRLLLNHKKNLSVFRPKRYLQIYSIGNQLTLPATFARHALQICLYLKNSVVNRILLIFCTFLRLLYIFGPNFELFCRKETVFKNLFCAANVFISIKSKCNKTNGVFPFIDNFWRDDRVHILLKINNGFVLHILHLQFNNKSRDHCLSILKIDSKDILNQQVKTILFWLLFFTIEKLRNYLQNVKPSI